MLNSAPKNKHPAPSAMKKMKSMTSYRQDWDCETALVQKAEVLIDKIDELEEELQVVLALYYRGDVRDKRIATSHRCLDYIAVFVVVGIFIGLFLLAIIYRGHDALGRRHGFVE